SGRFDAKVPLPTGTRFVVASGAGADVPDDQGAIALVRSLAAAAATSTRVVAVESGKAAQGRDPEVRAKFIGPLRAQGKDLDNRVSTVNNVEDFRGRVAAILALVDLGVGRVGHYGIGSAAGIASAPDATTYLLVDADTAHTAAAVAPLLAAVDGGADLAIGVLPPAGRRGGFGAVRGAAAWGIRRACGFEAEAPLSGQRAV